MRLKMLALLVGFGFAAPSGLLAQTALDATLRTCWSCHGENGLSKDPTVPIIFGQQAAYLEKQLRDFRAGDRDSQIMSSMAEAIPRDDIARAAAFIAGKAWPGHPAEPAPRPAAIATCQACHGESLAGGLSPEGVAPRLAGQFADYLDEQMSAFARGERANAKTMTAMMTTLSAADRDAMAKYLAGLRPAD